MLFGFGSVILFLIISVSISLFVVLLPFFISKYITKTYNPYKEKNSRYECGFDPITNDTAKFNIKYYLVGILFIIFDIEISFLFPWALMLKHIGWLGFSSMMIFLFVLTIGFIYELYQGALDW